MSVDKFIQQMNRQNKADNPKLVSKFALRWTQAQPLLTKKLFLYILQSNSKIARGKEAIAVETIIRNRLIKEFKQDKLTLTIRKILYKKDLESILRNTKGRITDQEKFYLLGLQKELGLTSSQCQTIRENISVFNDYQHSKQHAPLFSSSKKRLKNIKSNFSLTKINNKNLPVSASNIPLKHQTATLVERSKEPFKKQPTISTLLPKKLLWLLLCIPFLLLLVKILNWNQSYPSANIDPSLQQTELCVDPITRQSTRMSLGEKLLAEEYNNLEPTSAVAMYEAAAAFARCEFSTAKNKFQQSLATAKNNPEALIYLNNTTAIASENLKIAVSVPLGSKPEIASEILRGVAQAQAEINQQGGIEGKSLLVQIVNDDNNPEIVTSLAQQLVADKSTLAVVGHNSSNSSLTAAPIYQKQGLVMISPTSTSTKLSGLGGYIMRTVPSVRALADHLADYASINSLVEIAVCSDSGDSASSSFAEEFSMETIKNGGKIVSVECDFASQDFDPQGIVDAAVTNDVDALLLAPSVNKINQAITTARANQQQLPLLGNHSLYTAETIDEGKEAVAGMVLPSPWIPNAASHEDFPQQAMKYWGGQVNFRTAMAYDATKAIIQGLHQSDTRAELQSVLTQPNFLVEGATGQFYFKNGDRYGQVELARIKQAKQNSDQYKFSRLSVVFIDSP